MSADFSCLVGQTFYAGFEQTQVQVLGAYLERGDVFVIVVSPGSNVYTMNVENLKAPEEA